MSDIPEILTRIIFSFDGSNYDSLQEAEVVRHAYLHPIDERRAHDFQVGDEVYTCGHNLINGSTKLVKGIISKLEEGRSDRWKDDDTLEYYLYNFIELTVVFKGIEDKLKFLSTTEGDFESLSKDWHDLLDFDYEAN